MSHLASYVKSECHGQVLFKLLYREHAIANAIGFAYASHSPAFSVHLSFFCICFPSLYRHLPYNSCCALNLYTCLKIHHLEVAV
ncbi:hypothetical protein CY34DRAFT_807341 [Suillus luteus UH-Slu-Lm8-n1]|uniref:Uncharacterized protein n=1 Tax=Suillus luteus UH-Slu-Lm8-n1 TaxID=930992 RepID=A0A0D0AF14_9AGAM|nr:hypothetical protein CY34DRAFT_807341 [Suillus luteus UH-Slu-Lm8-n1]